MLRAYPKSPNQTVATLNLECSGDHWPQWTKYDTQMGGVCHTNRRCTSCILTMYSHLPSDLNRRERHALQEDAAFLLTVGSFLLTVELFYLQLSILAFLLTNGCFIAYSFSFFTYGWSFLAYSGKVRLIRTLRDCKQRSLTVSKRAPTVGNKASPFAKICNTKWMCIRIFPRGIATRVA